MTIENTRSACLCIPHEPANNVIILFYFTVFVKESPICSVYARALS